MHLSDSSDLVREFRYNYYVVPGTLFYLNVVQEIKAHSLPNLTVTNSNKQKKKLKIVMLVFLLCISGNTLHIST